MAPGPSPLTLVAALRAEGIEDEQVIEAFRTVDRRLFVPRQEADQAYQDRPVRLPYGQVTTQPSLVARMVAGLSLEGRERVLEIGTGFGFQTAILARLAREVFSVERFRGLADQARANLAAAGISGITIVVADGTLGLPDNAPYDAIIVSAAAPEVPHGFIEQLRDGGRLVQPIGVGGNEHVVSFRKRGAVLVELETLCTAHFVPLVGATEIRLG